MPSRDTTRVLVELQRPGLGDRVAASHLDPAAQRAYVSSLNGEVGALLGALRAKGVRLDGVVQYARVWHGFAATVRTVDMPKVQALGLRVEPVRRFYGALSTGRRASGEPVRSNGDPPAKSGTPTVALLDSGVDSRAPGLRGRVANGPDLSGGGRGDHHGTVVASVLARSLPHSQRVLSIRIAHREGDSGGRSPTESTTTDRLLAGLEHAVDPNGDGDASDAIPIALVGVNSPYSGFDDAPEAKAVRAAAGLGTLVIAPAGNEGPGSGAFGTIGSPAASPAALAVGAGEKAAGAVPRVDVGVASAGGRAVADGVLLAGRARPMLLSAVTLAGPSQANPRGGAAETGDSALQYLTVDARPRARRRVVVVPFRGRDGAEPPVADRAAAAAQAGAAALVVCDPDGGEGLAPLPAGVAPAIPVIGVGGQSARTLLAAASRRGAMAWVSAPGSGARATRTARYSSHGPTYTLAPKPDLVADGTALVARRNGQADFESGTSIAAARVAAAAAVLHSRRPALRPAALASALMGTARPAGTVLANGVGRAEPTTAARVGLVPESAALAFPPQRPGATWIAHLDLVVANTRRAPAVAHLTASSDDRVHLAVFPDQFLMAGKSTARVIVTVSGAAGIPAYAMGRVGIRGPRDQVTVPVAIPVETPPRPIVGALRLVRRAGRVAGVTFAAGSVRRGRTGIAVQAIRSLTLALVDSRGATVRELTPVGGAPDVLPGEYSYRLPSDTAHSLHGRGYRFRVIATGTAGGSTSSQSPPFDHP